MAAIEKVETGYYRVPLPVPLSDSTHGTMTSFELITARVRDAEGAEGVGYTYTTGHNGGAVARLLAHDIPEIVGREDADCIERLWQKVWWGLHYGGRGGPSVLAQSAFDMALWDLKARRANLPLWRLLGGHDPAVPCYAGGIDLHLSVDDLVKEHDANLAKGFRAIKMKAGRARMSEDVERLKGLRAYRGDGFPLMADANM